MKKSYLLFLFFSLTQLISAQYTDIINSNRPGFTNSPFSVGSNVYQIEGGLFYKKAQLKRGFSNPSTFGSSLSFRFSKFKEKLEFNLNLDYSRERLAYTQFVTTYYNTSGFSKAVIGAKYLLYKAKYADKSKEVRSWKKRMAFDKKRLIPSVGVYVGANLPILNDFYSNEFSPKIAIYLQNNITNRYIVLTNFILDKMGAQYASFSFILTQTYELNEKYSIFIDILNKNYSNFNNEFQLAGGVAYLKNKNLQFDASARLLIQNNSTNPYFSLGVAWRLDNHILKLKEKSDENFLNGKNYDKKIDLNKKNALIRSYLKPRKIRKPVRKIKAVKKKKQKKKKGIFSRLFKKRKKNTSDK